MAFDISCRRMLLLPCHPSPSKQVFGCGYPPLCLDEWEALASAAKVVCVRGRYTTYLDRDTASLFYHDEVSLCIPVEPQLIRHVSALVSSHAVDDQRATTVYPRNGRLRADSVGT